MSVQLPGWNDFCLKWTFIHDKVSALTHIHLDKPPLKIKVAIFSDQADNSLYVFPAAGGCGDLRVEVEWYHIWRRMFLLKLNIFKQY